MKTPDPYKLSLQMEPMEKPVIGTVRWTMINNIMFFGEREGYEITIKSKAAFGSPYWSILKDGILIDECFNHRPTKCELTAKAQSERVLNNILKLLR